MDTICSILAHLLNKFIAKLQESTEFDNTAATSSKGKARENASAGGKGLKEKQGGEAGDPSSALTRPEDNLARPSLGALVALLLSDSITGR